MTDYQDYDEYDVEEAAPAQPTGQNLVKDLRRQLKEKAEAEKQLRERLEAIETERRRDRVSSVLESKGVNAKVAALIPSDVDATEDAVSKWLEGFSDVFGIKKPDVPSEVVSPDQAAQLQQVTEMTATAQPSNANARVTEADFNSATSLEDVLALIQKGSA